MDEEIPTVDPGRLKAPWVYIDASVYRQLGLDWNHDALSRLADLAQRGLVCGFRRRRPPIPI